MRFYKAYELQDLRLTEQEEKQTKLKIRKKKRRIINFLFSVYSESRSIIHTKTEETYYPIDPWKLEGVLFNCATMGLKVNFSKLRFSAISKETIRSNEREKKKSYLSIK